MYKDTQTQDKHRESHKRLSHGIEPAWWPQPLRYPGSQDSLSFYVRSYEQFTLILLNKTRKWPL